MRFLFENHEAPDITVIEEMVASAKSGQANQKALKTILNCIDLTTLEGSDTLTRVDALCQKAISFADEGEGIPNVAAVCVYPPFVREARRALAGSELSVASVAGAFPSGQSPIQVKLHEIVYAVAEGAQEIDMVISRGKFLEGDLQTVFDEIVAIREVTRDVHLKVILETGELATLENIRKASEMAILAGADFIKTSTGKMTPAATPEAACVMLQAIRDYYKLTGKKIGFKPAGGISDVDSALVYYYLVQQILGEEWLNNKLFRIGASRLADRVLERIK